MVHNNPKKNERLKGRNYKYKENYIIEVNSMHGDLNINQKRTHLKYLKKEKKIDLMNPSREITQFKVKMKI